MNKFSLYDSHHHLLMQLIIEFSKQDPEYNPVCGCIHDIMTSFYQDLNILYKGTGVLVPDKRAKWFAGDDGLARTKIVKIYYRGLAGMSIITDHGTYSPASILEVLNE